MLFRRGGARLIVAHERSPGKICPGGAGRDFRETVPEFR